MDPTQRSTPPPASAERQPEGALLADHTLPATPTFSVPIVGSPVTLALDPLGHFVYVGSRTDDFQMNVDVFKTDADSGALTSVGDALRLDGPPGYFALDPTGHFAYLTKSNRAGIWGYTVNPTSGLLSNSSRTEQLLPTARGSAQEEVPGATRHLWMRRTRAEQGRRGSPSASGDGKIGKMPEARR